MSIEFIGWTSTRAGSELTAVGRGGGNALIDRDYFETVTHAHEDAGFDKVLIGYFSTAPDGLIVASQAARFTDRLGFLIAHRPGFMAPTLAARTLATLDQFTGGRVSVHIITGSTDDEQQRDGDWLDKDTRYRRTDEYLDIMRGAWTAEKPFDYEGEFYRVKNAFSEVKPRQQPHLPIYYGGASGPAVPVGAKHCDVYMFWGEPVAWIKERMAEVQAAAAPYGRSPRFSVSLRPILGATEARAWERAHSFLERVTALRGTAGRGAPAQPQASGSQRLLEAAAKAEIHDTRLWTPLAAATGAGGNSTALVGTPEQVAEALLAYYDAGVGTILIRGYEPLQDAIDYGRDLIPLVRAEVARRERTPVAS